MEEMLALLDADLAIASHRERFSGQEVADMILDLRQLLTREPIAAP